MERKRQKKAGAKRKRAGVTPPLPTVDASMNVLEILALHPGAADVLSAYGLHCHGCAFGSMDTLEEGARAHGLQEEDLENMLSDLRDVLKTAPKKPSEFTLTTAAAEALLKIAQGEGKSSCLLTVISDGSGGFCMEFGEETGVGDIVFRAPNIEAVSLAIAPQVLARIGGGSVDFRDGRFKLDIPTGCGCGGSCVCKK